MDRRYRLFAYFIGVLIAGSILINWLSGSIRVPETTRAEDSRAFPSQSPDMAAPPMNQQPTSEAGASYQPTYAPSYENPSVSEESSTVREAPPSEQQPPARIESSSDLQPPAPPPTASAEAQDSPDEGQYTTTPKSSNAALRETLKKSKER